MMTTAVLGMYADISSGLMLLASNWNLPLLHVFPALTLSGLIQK